MPNTAASASINSSPFIAPSPRSMPRPNRFSSSKTICPSISIPTYWSIYSHNNGPGRRPCPIIGQRNPRSSPPRRRCRFVYSCCPPMHPGSILLRNCGDGSSRPCFICMDSDTMSSNWNNTSLISWTNSLTASPTCYDILDSCTINSLIFISGCGGMGPGRPPWASQSTRGKAATLLR